MNDLNIPLYRAEVSDNKLNFEKIEQFTELINDKRYVTGLLNGKERHIEVTKDNVTTFIVIDNTTLSIHFNDMLDSQGNKIFASLSKDGKGGDVCEKHIVGYAHNKPELFTSCIMNGNTYAKYSKDDKELLYNLITSHTRVNKCKINVIGIQK